MRALGLHVVKALISLLPPSSTCKMNLKNPQFILQVSNFTLMLFILFSLYFLMCQDKTSVQSYSLLGESSITSTLLVIQCIELKNV